jgi:hypothetical protein
LVADRRTDEIRAITVETIAHEQVHAAEIDEAEVDGDLLAVGVFGSRLGEDVRHCRPFSIRLDGV